MKIPFHDSLSLPETVTRQVTPLAWPRERALLLAVLLMAGVALASPALRQPAHYHDFADQRAWGGLPHAMDVLSNLPFAAWGLAGAWALARAIRLRAVGSASAWLTGLFFGGLIVTAAVSAAYHWQPDNAGLLWDRVGMALAFAGLLGLSALQGISTRAGVALAAAVLVLGPLCVQVWAVSGNALPWGVLQFGGMGLIVWLANLRPLPDPSGLPQPGLPIRWALVMALYALAKLLELGDSLVYDWSMHLISGHSLKHGVASCAAWPVVAALVAATKAVKKAGQNPVQPSNAAQAVGQRLPRNNLKTGNLV